MWYGCELQVLETWQGANGGHKACEWTWLSCCNRCFDTLKLIGWLCSMAQKSITR